MTSVARFLLSHVGPLIRRRIHRAREGTSLHKWHVARLCTRTSSSTAASCDVQCNLLLRCKGAADRVQQFSVKQIRRLSKTRSHGRFQAVLGLWRRGRAQKSPCTSWVRRAEEHHQGQRRQDPAIRELRHPTSYTRSPTQVDDLLEGNGNAREAGRTPTRREPEGHPVRPRAVVVAVPGSVKLGSLRHALAHSSVIRGQQSTGQGFQQVPSKSLRSAAPSKVPNAQRDEPVDPWPTCWARKKRRLHRRVHYTWLSQALSPSPVQALPHISPTQRRKKTCLSSCSTCFCAGADPISRGMGGELMRGNGDAA